MPKAARDLALLDLIDAHTGIVFEGDVWRIVREGRDVLQGYPAGGRWDPGTFDVVYTSLEREGALEEIYFHLSRQPVFPSKIKSVLYRISVKTRRTLKLADISMLQRLGVEIDTYGDLKYARMQEIGDAASFLGFDGLIAPCARWPCQNLVLFSEKFEPGELVVAEQQPVDWKDWASRRSDIRRTRGVSP